MVVVAMWDITAVLAKASILNVTMVDWAVGLNPCFYLQSVCFVPVCFTHGNSLQTKWLCQCYLEGGCWDVTNRVWLGARGRGMLFLNGSTKLGTWREIAETSSGGGILCCCSCRVTDLVRIVQMFCLLIEQILLSFEVFIHLQEVVVLGSF